MSLSRAAGGEVPAVVPVPGHPEAKQSPRYQLFAGGHAIEVKAERYSFDVAMFTMGTTPVVVNVAVAEDFERYSLKPDRHGVAVERMENTLQFIIEQPHKLVLQIPGLKPLAIIVTPNEVEVPSPEDPHVVYFKPGITEAGVIQPQSGQTIYLAPGALVKGRIEAQGVEGVRVLGRGLLETQGYSIRDEKLHGILFDHSKDIRVEGIGVRSYDTWWQTLFLNTIDAEVAHVNLFGIGVNTDGVDIDAVKNFVVRDSFIRCEDDGLGWHALDAEANGEMITENAVADNLVIWNTRAGNGIRIGASMEAQLWRNITIRNVDILMHARAGIHSDYSDWAWMDNLRFENIVIEKPSRPIDFFIGKTRYSNKTGYMNKRGHMHGLVFENVAMNGGSIQLLGSGKQNRIHRVRFNGCTNDGQAVDSIDDIKINPYVTDLRFNEPLLERSPPAPGFVELEDCESSVSGGVQFIVDERTAHSGRSRIFAPRQPAASIRHVIPAPKAGVYQGVIWLRVSANSTQLELKVNGDVVAGSVELDASNAEFRAFDCGRVVVQDTAPIELILTNLGEGDTRIEMDAVEFRAISVSL